MKTIGVIGGSSDVATAEYYKLINAGIKARLGGSHTAEMIINSMDFGEVERLVTGNLWEEGEQYVNNHAKALERGTYSLCPAIESRSHHRVQYTCCPILQNSLSSQQFITCYLRYLRTDRHWTAF